MIIARDDNNNWTPVATGNGQFVGTKAAFDAVKDDLPDNTVAYTTDDGTDITTITGTSRTVSVTANTTDWYTLTAPTIPSDKRVVRYFATVNEGQARASVGYSTSSTPTGVIVSSSVSGDVTIALAAVVVDK